MSTNIAAGLTAADPAHADTWRANAAAFIAEIEQTDTWIAQHSPPSRRQRRRIITTHDAFGYYGDRYGVTFLAAEGISTDAEPSAKGIAALVAQIKREQVRMVFLENMTDPRITQDAGAGDRRDRVGSALFRRLVEAGRTGAGLPDDAALQYSMVRPRHAAGMMAMPTAHPNVSPPMSPPCGSTVCPPPAIEAAKIWILDTLGVGIAGLLRCRHGRDPRRRRRSGATARGSDHLGHRANAPPRPPRRSSTAPRSTIRSSIACTKARVVHAMATLLPAVLAVAERDGGVSGRDLIAAVVAGIDIAANLGLASTAGFRFFRPATAGGFGAVAGLAVIAGLDAERTADAFGLQYGQTSGTMQPHAEGNALLPMQIGFNAQSAVRSVDLARAGVSGPRDIFEGRYGYFPLFEGSWDLRADLERAWPRLARLRNEPQALARRPRHAWRDRRPPDVAGAARFPRRRCAPVCA